MATIRLTQDAYLAGHEDAFYRFTTDEGKPSIKGIWGERYEAMATDDEGNEYFVVWSIADREAHERGDEDCCDWCNPDEILNTDTGLPVDAKLVW